MQPCGKFHACIYTSCHVSIETAPANVFFLLENSITLKNSKVGEK